MQVNVIIPVYNAEKSLVKCVESLIFGSFKDVEIILVEDCSTDHSWELCLNLAGKYKQVRCYRNDRNHGVSYTRNHGLEVADSEYIIFVDADDWVSSCYIEELVNGIERKEKVLPICGLHFIDYVNGNSRDYQWNGAEEYTFVGKEHFFELIGQFMIQQLWNKIFILDAIRRGNVRFDESQSMGEDFQFVIDYIEAANIAECLMIKKCLYYYIRANSTSLMSKFGLVENENEYARLKKLSIICGINNPEVQNAYQKAYEQLQDNYIYHACRQEKFSKSDIIFFIEGIKRDGKAKRYYNRQKQLIFKEQCMEFLQSIKKLPIRFKGKIERSKRDKIAADAKKCLQNKGFTLISQNCIGGVIYHDMGLRFDSPTIDLYFSAPDFIRFVSNLEYYLSITPTMRWKETYPVGLIGDIEVNFMHYETCSMALEKWEERKLRIHWDNIIVLCTDMEEFGSSEFDIWNRIPYSKILFTAQERFSDIVGCVYYPEFKSNGSVIDLIPKRLFYRNGIVMDTINMN